MAFPEDRPGGYDPDQVFDESANEYVDIDSGDVQASGLGGGKYGQQLVTLSDQGKIYFGALT